MKVGRMGKWETKKELKRINEMIKGLLLYLADDIMKREYGEDSLIYGEWETIIKSSSMSGIFKEEE